MCQAAGQKTNNKYCDGLIRYFSDGNDLAHICEGCAEKSKADYLRAHCGANDVSSKTCGKGGYDSIRGFREDGEKYQKDKQ